MRTAGDLLLAGALAVGCGGQAGAGADADATGGASDTSAAPDSNDEVGGSPAPESEPRDAQGCLDLSSLDSCEASSSGYGTPAVLLRADELGPGFALSSINEHVVIATDGERYRGVALVDYAFPKLVFELELAEADSDLELRDALWLRWQPGRPFFVLGCRGDECELLRPSRVDEDWGLPAGPLEASGVRVDAALAAQRLLGKPDGEELCVVGRGIACLDADADADAWRSGLDGAGPIAAVAGELALASDGRVFSRPYGPEPSTWTAVAEDQRFDRLTLDGAFASDGRWLRLRRSAVELDCVSRPIVAGSQSGLLDAQGTIYPYRYFRGYPRFCHGGVPFTAPDDVIGEANLTCGIASNWVVATSESVVGMAGELGCVID